MEAYNRKKITLIAICLSLYIINECIYRIFGKIDSAGWGMLYFSNQNLLPLILLPRLIKLEKVRQFIKIYWVFLIFFMFKTLWETYVLTTSNTFTKAVKKYESETWAIAGVIILIVLIIIFNNNVRLAKR